MATTKRKGWLRPLLQITAFGLLGAGVGFLVAREFKVDGAPLTAGQKWLAVAATLVALWFSLAVHELSHVAAGLVQGFHLQQLVVGFLGLRRAEDGRRLELYFNTDMTFFGGMCAVLPERPSPALSRQYAWVLLAGPLGSLLLGTLGFGAFWSLRMAGYAFAHPVLVFLLVFGLSSLAVFAATTLPSRTGIFLTDRARFFRLMGGGPEARAEQQMLHLIALDHSGFPWKKLNVEEYADARQDAAYGLYAELYAYWHYLDTGQREQALASAQRFEATPEDWPETLKVVLWKEACFAQAWLAADTDAARPWWERIHYFVKRQPDAAGLRAQAAWHMAQGDYAAGREAAERALRLFDRLRRPTATACAEKRLLEAMLSAAVASPRTAATPST